MTGNGDFQVKKITASFLIAAILITSVCVAVVFFYVINNRTRSAATSQSVETDGFALPVSSGINGKTSATFTDITLESGIDFRHHQADEIIDSLPQVMGSGVCLLDYDNDGYLDIYFVNGSGFSNYYGSKPWWYKQPSNILYRNRGNGTFTDVTQKSGVGYTGWGMGCSVGDFNNDGYSDIYITNYGSNVLYKNNGNGSFSNITDSSGVGGAKKKWSTSAAWVDYDNDGWLDLYVLNYIKYDKYMNPPEPSSSFKNAGNLLMNSKIYTSAPNILFHNNKDGTFTEVTKKAGVEDSPGKGLGVVFSDMDSDGDQDVYIVNDGARNMLYKNNGDGIYTDIGGEAHVDTPLSGMGVSVGDYDHDGDFDIFSTYASNDTSILYRNRLIDGNNQTNYKNSLLLFKDVTIESMLGEDVSVGYFGWGTGFIDYDNDGYLDIFVANGDPSPDFDNPRTTIGQRNQLFHNNRAGGFAEVSKSAGSGFDIMRSSRGAAFGDLDNDGDIDIVINNNNEFANVLRNDGGNNRNWLNIKLTGTRSNKNGIGAFVKMTAGKLQQINEVRSGSSYLSQSDTRLHFGLGVEKSIDRIDIRWPSGLTQSIKEVDANQFITITEGEDKVQMDKRVKPGPSKIIRRHGTDSMDTDAILQALKSRDPQKKKAAITSLKDVDDEATIDMAIEPVILTFEDSNKEVRREAVTFFCKLFKEEQTILRATIHRRRLAVVPLLNLLNDPEPEVRLEAIKALGYSESYRAIIPVAKMLRDKDKGVRREAALALGHLRDRRGIDYLLDTLKNSEEDSSVRSGAILSLIRLESEITTSPIFEEMSAQDERTRLRALETLKMALSEDESVLLKRKEMIRPLEEALKDQSPEIRREALKVIAHIKDPVLVPAVINALSDSSTDVRMDAIKTLAGIKDSRAVEPLIELFSDEDHSIRSGAINALSGFMDKRTVPYLLKIMSDKNESADIRLLIMSALRQIDPSQWTKSINLLVEDPSPEIRREAIRGISTLQDPGTVTLLLACLMDKDKEVRREVVLALGNYKENRVVDSLISIVKSSTEEKDIRSDAITSLVSIGDERAVIHLMGIARNKRDELQGDAAIALKSFGSDSLSRKDSHF